MRLRTIEDVERALRPYYVIASEMTGKDMTTERTKQFLQGLGNPHEKLRIVHIAGTSGKTSTSYFISRLLSAAGCKVGLTISPHVDSLTERVQIGTVPLPEKIFVSYMHDFLTQVAHLDITPSWYELMTGFAFWVFAKEQVDYAVVETGLGGLHDATNVAERSDKLCVITDIGMDHMNILGDSISAIALQKVGIVHDRNILIMYDQSPEVMKVIRYFVSQQEDADVLTFEQERLFAAAKVTTPVDMPQYQIRNWLLAFAAYKYLVRRDELTDLAASELVDTMHLQVPARMERHTIDDTTVLLDGAHNEQKMSALVSSLTAQYPGQKPTVLIALKLGKETEDIARLLAPVAGKVLISSFHNSQDMPIKAQDPEHIRSVFDAHGIQCEVMADPNDAYSTALKTSDLVLITGSFYFIAELRARHSELRHD